MSETEPIIVIDPDLSCQLTRLGIPNELADGDLAEDMPAEEPELPSTPLPKSSERITSDRKLYHQMLRLGIEARLVSPEELGE